MKNSQISALFELIETEKVQFLKKENLFQKPAKIYCALKTMYQAYKKEHEFELLQDKIYSIKVTEESKINLPEPGRVTAKILCQSHHLNAEDIYKLITIKQNLQKDYQRELLEEIINQLNCLDHLPGILKCYKQILRSTDCIKNPISLYKYVEDKMIEKIMGMELTPEDLRLLPHFILSLPNIGDKMLYFMGELFSKIQELHQFNQIQLIFFANFPAEPSVGQIQYLMKISTPKSLQLIINLIQKSENVIQLAQNEAKYKLKNMQIENCEKLSHILDFIIIVVGFGCPIWPQIIEWENRASKQARDFLKVKLQDILIKMMKDEGSFSTVLNIISKMTQIEQESQIGKIFVEEFLMNKEKSYLNNRFIRRFVASRVIQETNHEHYLPILLNPSLRYTQVFLEIFNLGDQCLAFFKAVLTDKEKNQLLREFLDQLVVKKPVKFKDFFISVDKFSKGDLMNINDYTLINLFKRSITVQLAFSIIRECSFYFPSRFIVPMLYYFAQKFSDKPHYQALRSQIVRSLNIMLIRTPTQELNDGFKFHLPNLVRKMNKDETQKIFVNVPETTVEELKRSHNEMVKLR